MHSHPIRFDLFMFMRFAARRFYSKRPGDATILIDIDTEFAYLAFTWWCFSVDAHGGRPHDNQD